MSRWRRWLVPVLGALGLLLAAWLGPRALRAMPLFRVRRVDVVGARYLTAADVARRLRLGPKASIFDDQAGAVRRVVTMDGVARAEIDRRLPGALVVRITEWEPVALARAGGKLVMVDRLGRPLPFDPSRGPADLPIAVTDSAVTRLLDRLREAEPELYGRVITAERDRNTVMLETAARRLLLRVGATVKEMQALVMVEAEIERRRLEVAELDARFDGRVVARGRRA